MQGPFKWYLYERRLYFCIHNCYECYMPAHLIFLELIFIVIKLT